MFANSHRSTQLRLLSAFVLASALCSAAAAVSPSAPEVRYHAFNCAARDDSLELSLVLPSNASTPSPIVVFVNGFQLRSCVYLPYALQLADAGYATLLIDDAKSPFSDVQAEFSDAARVEWIDRALGCLAHEHDTNAYGIAGKLDFTRVSVAGHSRGGKVAGLYFAEHAGHTPWLMSAYLIDPVDTPVNSSHKCMPFLPSYNQTSTPNLAEMLPALDAPLGIVGTALQSSCNCNSSGFREVWHGGPPEGSWLLVLQQAGHLQVSDESMSHCGGEHLLNRLVLKAVYADLSWLPGPLKSLSCVRGPLQSSEAMDIVGRAMAAFMDKTVRGVPETEAFKTWLHDLESNDVVTFQRQGERKQQRMQRASGAVA